MKRVSLILSGLVSACLVTGCVQSGARPSIWPTLKAGSDTPEAGISNKLSSTAQGVKGQLSTMGTAVTSAYGKAKTSITSAFSGTTESTGESATVSNKSASLGPEIFVANGQLYESTGQYPKAIDNYSKALEIEPKNVPALLSMARLHQRQNEHSKATDFYKKAIEVSPGDAQLYSDLGGCYAKQSQLANARQEYLKAINLQPKNRNHRIAMANVLMDEGKTDEALNELAQVDAPAMANYQMAYLYFGRQNIPAAQQHLSSALQIDPNLQPARELMNQMGGPQMAQRAYGAYQTVGNTLQTIQGIGAASSTVSQSFDPAIQSAGAQMPIYSNAPGSLPLQSTVPPTTIMR